MSDLPSRIVVVVGGQFGSEGKGAVCAALANTCGTLSAIRTGGPNAGHTVWADDQKWTFRQVPVSAVIRPDSQLFIAAGSEVDAAVLEQEVEATDAAGYRVSERLMVDSGATLLTGEHIDAEGHYGGHLTQRIGSTGKGVGAARVDRLRRDADLWCANGFLSGDTVSALNDQYEHGGRTLLIEGSQGYGLGLHAGYYPFCTSRDCRAIDDLAMVGIHPQVTPEVWVTLRTYPIRVAGNSGPMHHETSWERLNKRSGGYIQVEQTSVTKKVRRVGEWDGDLARSAVRANGGKTARVALMMFDYWYPELAGATRVSDLGDEHLSRIAEVELDVGTKVGMLGTSPDSHIRLS